MLLIQQILPWYINLASLMLYNYVQILQRICLLLVYDHMILLCTHMTTKIR